MQLDVPPLHGLRVAEIGTSPGLHAWPALSRHGRVELLSNFDQHYGDWEASFAGTCGTYRPYAGYDVVDTCERYVVSDAAMFVRMVDESLIAYWVVAIPPGLPDAAAVLLFHWCQLFGGKRALQYDATRDENTEDLLSWIPQSPALLVGFFGDAPETVLVHESPEVIETARVSAATNGAIIKEIW